jgi:polyphosphate glucokinase
VIVDTAPEQRVLVVDVGGSHVKVLATGEPKRRRFESGPELTAQKMVDGVLELTEDWTYDVVSVGIPAPIKNGGPAREPVNLGPDWVGFDYERAFGRPTKVVNDAVMQALGSYDGGSMLFLGLGTGLGTAMVVDGGTVGMELGHLPFRKATFEDYVGERGLEHLGRKRWERAVKDTVKVLTAALLPDYVVLGGGNAKTLTELPPGTRLGENSNAFLGGFRLWNRDAALPEHDSG